MGCFPSKKKFILEPSYSKVHTRKNSFRSRNERQSKRQRLLVDSSALKHIDEHVRKTPQAAKRSLQSLAAYLGSAASNDLEKARAVYKWVTANISYDTDGYFGIKEKSSNDAESVIKNGTCVCEGYASLSLSLLQLLGIECIKISGYSKGFGYDPTKPLTTDKEADHAWNAVKLDGEWRFIETTWGAGHLNENKKFERNETDFHFLTDPEVFIEAHFPYMKSDMAESKKWQLLEKPIDLNTFHSRVKRQKACIEHQVELVSHKQALIDVDGEVTLKFRGTGRPLTSFSARFVNPSTGERMSSGKYIATVLDHRTNEATVTARPPTSGAFWELQVFANTNGSKSSEMIVSYCLRSRFSCFPPQFPDSTGYYGLHKSPEQSGFTKDFCGNDGFWIKVDGGIYALKIPLLEPIKASAHLLHAESAEPDSRACAAEITETYLMISFRMRRTGFYELDLFSQKFDSEETHRPCVASFLIECTKPLNDPEMFPDYSGFYGVQMSPERVGFTKEFLAEGRFFIRNSDGQLEIKLPILKPVRSSANLKFARDVESDTRSCAVEATDKFLTISLRMKVAGFYELKLFIAEFESVDSKYSHMASFLIECTKPLKVSKMFPDYKGFYGVHLNPKDFGFDNQFQTERNFFLRDAGGRCKLKFPTSALVCASVSLCIADKSADRDEFSFVEAKSDCLKVSLRMTQEAFYQLNLFCKPQNSMNSTESPLFATFLIDCVKPIDQPRPFPETYRDFCKEQVSLECPRDGELSANSEIQFRLDSPTLKKLMVNREVYSRTETGFHFVARTGRAGSELAVFGTSDESSSSYSGLCKYRVV